MIIFSKKNYIFVGKSFQMNSIAMKTNFNHSSQFFLAAFLKAFFSFFKLTIPVNRAVIVIIKVIQILLLKYVWIAIWLKKMPKDKNKIKEIQTEM